MLNLYRIYILSSLSSESTMSHFSVSTIPCPHFPIPCVLTRKAKLQNSLQFPEQSCHSSLPLYKMLSWPGILFPP